MSHRSAQERPGQLRIPLEPTGREDHAAASPDPLRAFGTFHDDADDLTIGDDQFAYCVGGAGLDAAVEARSEQPPGQGLAAAPFIVDTSALQFLRSRRLRDGLPSGVSLMVIRGSAKYGDGVTRSRFAEFSTEDAPV